MYLCYWKGGICISLTVSMRMSRLTSIIVWTYFISSNTVCVAPVPLWSSLKKDLGQNSLVHACLHGCRCFLWGFIRGRLFSARVLIMWLKLLWLWCCLLITLRWVKYTRRSLCNDFSDAEKRHLHVNNEYAQTACFPHFCVMLACVRVINLWRPEVMRSEWRCLWS